MVDDKTRTSNEAVQAMLERWGQQVSQRRLTLWDYTRHISRAPFDYCPFECGFCDELRDFDAALKRGLTASTPVL